MGLAFCSIQLLTQVLSLTSKKCCHVGVHVILGLYDFLFYYETEGRHANAKFLSSREEISQPGIEPPTSSLRFGYLSTIVQ